MKKRLLKKQKLMGIILLIISVAIVLMALNGNTIQERDVTPLLIFVPMALYMIFSKNVVIS